MPKKTPSGQIEARILVDTILETGEKLACNSVVTLDAAAVKALVDAGAADTHPEAIKAAKE